MPNITDRINNNLKAIYNIDDDELYKEFVCDKDGTIPATITIPTDIDIGIIASQIEYLRLLSISLVNQLYIDQATGQFLKYELEQFFNFLQFQSETEADYIERAISMVFQPRVSTASIISALRPYSMPLPEINRIRTDSGFADCSFADIYDTYVTIYEGEDFHVFAARSSEFGSSFFSINITLYNFEGNLQKAVNVIEAYIAAGIQYTLSFVNLLVD